jgi:hypothetical protein
MSIPYVVTAGRMDKYAIWLDQAGQSSLDACNVAASVQTNCNCKSIRLEWFTFTA